MEKPMIVIGPHCMEFILIKLEGPCFLFGYALFIGLSVIVLKFEYSNENTSRRTFTCTFIIAIIQLISYALVAIKNPGVANQPLETLPEDIHKIPHKPMRREHWFLLYIKCRYCETCRLI
jgi:hypothetical protein